MKDALFLNGDTSVTVIVPEATEDVQIIVDGPRPPFVVSSETNGMHFRFGGPLAADERLWVQAASRTCYRRLKATRGAERVPCADLLFVSAAQEGWGWMRLAKGRNTLTLTAE